MTPLQLRGCQPRSDKITGAALMGLLDNLAAETGATIMMLHHFNKGGSTKTRWREALRGRYRCCVRWDSQPTSQRAWGEAARHRDLQQGRVGHHRRIQSTAREYGRPHQIRPVAGGQVEGSVEKVLQLSDRRQDQPPENAGLDTISHGQGLLSVDPSTGSRERSGSRRALFRDAFR